MSRVGLCVFAALLAVALGPRACSQSDFDQPLVYPLPQEAITTVIGDLNSDGRDDVAVATWPSGLFVFYQQPDGTLSSPIQLYAPNMPIGLAVGDINGDSRMDLATSGSGGVIMLYYQEPDGSFGFPRPCDGYGLVNSLVIADFNGDGLADIADTSADYPVVLISPQLPDGTFGMPGFAELSGYNARSIRALDFNADGLKDVALLVDDQVCLLTNTGSGFDPPRYFPAQWAYDLAAGDVTGDGLDDLIFTVATNQPDAAIGVISQDNPSSPQLYPAYDFAQPVAIADLNGDGKNDVVTAHGGYEAVTAFYQGADGRLGEWSKFATVYAGNYEPGALAVGDLNSDGSPDLAMVDWYNGLVVLPRKPGDRIAPTCSATISGISGANGWYVSDVSISISAEDNAGGSGLADILITRDGTTWTTYSESIVVSAQGTTRIGYRAEDKAGNKSDIQWVEVKLDTEPPVLSIEPQIKEFWPPNGGTINVPVIINAADATSGIAGLHVSVTDEYGLVEPECDLAGSGTIMLPLVAIRNDTDSDGRVYTLVLTGTDAAGNTSIAVSTVTVPRSNPGKPDKPDKPDKPKKPK